MKGLAAAIRGVASVVGVAFIACHSVPPRQAEGFRPELLGRLSLGMSEADVITLLGAPLRREGAGRGPQARELMTYAEYGASIKGDVSIGSKGYDCFLWLHAGQLDEVWFVDTTTHKKCQCQKGDCPPEWAVPCQTSRAP